MSEALIIFGETSRTAQPGKGPLDDSGQAGDFEGALTSFDDDQFPTLTAFDLGRELFAF